MVSGERLDDARWHTNSVLTILDERGRQVIFFLHQTQVQSSTVSNLVIDIIQASPEQNLNAALDLWILLADAKLSKSSDCGGPHGCVFENNSIINIADILGGLR